MSEQEKYKLRMTNLRRQHLRSGLLELYNRKVVMTQQMAEKSTARQNERTRLMTQAPHEDERLTNTSIPTSMLITPGGSSSNALLINDPTTATALRAQKGAKVAKQDASKIESRRDALHTLYMNARTFITTEQQLAAEIDRVFDNPKSEWGSAVQDGENIWNREPPVTIATLLQESTGSVADDWIGTAIHRGNRQRYRTDQQRMKRLAEELSGGKM